MKQKLELSQFDAASQQVLEIHSGPVGMGANPPGAKARLISSAPSSSLIISRVVGSTCATANRFRLLAILILSVLVTAPVEARIIRPQAGWSEGWLVGSDRSSKSFTLAPKGGRTPLRFVWNGQTREGFANAAKGGPVLRAESLKSNRPVRVLFQNRGGTLLAKRIIFLAHRGNARLIETSTLAA